MIRALLDALRPGKRITYTCKLGEAAYLVGAAVPSFCPTQRSKIEALS
jgi:hypothetical protein